jgi:hypothetical protein
MISTETKEDTPAAPPKTEEVSVLEKCVQTIIALGALFVGCWFMYAVYLTCSPIIGYFECGMSLSNEVCNGGTCGTLGRCICRSPLFFGSACNVTLCPGFSARENTVCGGHGVCEAATDGRMRAVPRACFNGAPFLPNLGWDSQNCLAYIKDIEDSAVPVLQYTEKGIIVMAPTCTCSTGWTGRKCDVPAVPAFPLLKTCFNMIDAEIRTIYGLGIDELIGMLPQENVP